MLQIYNAEKKFGNISVLNQMNLIIETNTVVGLAGPSGSGKSTLLRCIQSLECLDKGTITVAGKSGFMFQDFQLFPHMTVLKNLTYAPNRANPANKNTNHTKALELLNTLNLRNKAQAFPQQLSGGQKQRVALARSLMMQPDLLLCDEPTSGLDIASICDVINLLNTVKAMNITMVIASHDLEFLARISDRIILLKSGTLVADAPTKQLTNPTAYFAQHYMESAA